VGRERDEGRVGDRAHALVTPSREVGDEDVLAEVELRLEEDPPASRTVRSAGLLIERAQLLEQNRAGSRVWGGWPRAREELTVHDLGHEMVGHLHQILVGGPALHRAARIARAVPAGRRGLAGARSG